MIPGGSGLVFFGVSSVEMVIPLTEGFFTWLLPSPPFAMAIVRNSIHVPRLLPILSARDEAATSCAPLHRGPHVIVITALVTSR